ncbi:MAG: substrate-binding domain-containing protein [Acidobacteriota bacterium]|nr:MAG: substrate-binding domain-containing protein [Acidobacteriota bacterium]
MAKEQDIVESVIRACRILQAFAHHETLSLGQIVERTGLSRTTCFRLLQSLTIGGMLVRVGKGGYRSVIQSSNVSPFTIGFASQATESEFSKEVNQSVHRVAEREHLRLIAVNNDYSPKTALRNADLLIREGVNLALEFQTYEHVAPIISSKFLDANIPVIAIEIPHPGAFYFGADNYQAGLIGGRALGRWAKKNWDGKVEELLLLELPIAGPLPQLRITGTLAGLTQVLPGIRNSQTVHLNGNGNFEKSLDIVRRHLRRIKPKRTLVAAVNDPSALGALRAFEEAGRAHLCAVMGQNAIRDAREELRRPGTPLIGSVGYFPERYGEELIPLALSILQRKPVPSTVFVNHQLINAGNVELLYPSQMDNHGLASE